MVQHRQYNSKEENFIVSSIEGKVKISHPGKELHAYIPMDPSIQIEYAEIIEDNIHIIARSRVQP